MKFDIKVWQRYRNEATVLGNHIASHKDHNGFIIMKKADFKDYIQQITDILKECSNYMDKCGMTAPAPLWKYKADNPETHPSHPAFKYKDRMTPKAIKIYNHSDHIKFMSAKVS